MGSLHFVERQMLLLIDRYLALHQEKIEEYRQSLHNFFRPNSSSLVNAGNSFSSSTGWELIRAIVYFDSCILIFKFFLIHF